MVDVARNSEESDIEKRRKPIWETGTKIYEIRDKEEQR
jgi:hypothetical protein